MATNWETVQAFVKRNYIPCLTGLIAARGIMGLVVPLAPYWSKTRDYWFQQDAHFFSYVNWFLLEILYLSWIQMTQLFAIPFHLGVASLCVPVNSIFTLTYCQDTVWRRLFLLDECTAILHFVQDLMGTLITDQGPTDKVINGEFFTVSNFLLFWTLAITGKFPWWLHFWSAPSVWQRAPIQSFLWVSFPKWMYLVTWAHAGVFRHAPFTGLFATIALFGTVVVRRKVTHYLTQRFVLPWYLRQLPYSEKFQVLVDLILTPGLLNPIQRKLAESMFLNVWARPVFKSSEVNWADRCAGCFDDRHGGTAMVVFLPCAHAVFCSDCWEQTAQYQLNPPGRCPLCKMQFAGTPQTCYQWQTLTKEQFAEEGKNYTETALNELRQMLKGQDPAIQKSRANVSTAASRAINAFLAQDQEAQR